MHVNSAEGMDRGCMEEPQGIIEGRQNKLGEG